MSKNYFLTNIFAFRTYRRKIMEANGLPSSDSCYSISTSRQKCAHCKRKLSISETVPTCNKCHKVFYCSESHKKSHLSKHEKAGCFPAIVQSDSDRGRYWIASRDIAIDEVIFLDVAVVLSPTVSSTSTVVYPTCLGCCRQIYPTPYFCSKCGWPVCSKRCEQMAWHRNFECKIFKKNAIPANYRSPQYYIYIQCLRTLLLKDRDLKEVMELEAHVKSRSTVREEVLMLSSFYKFLTDDCNLDYDYNFVNHVMGVNRVNCYSADGLIHGKKRFCTAVFPKLSLINHNCKPNTRTILHEKCPGILHMELRASVPIKKGEEISQQYITSTKGSLVRQTLLEDWYFQCKCDRCIDVTELNTYFSALKCVKVNCSGFLLPEDPMNIQSPWTCKLCSDSKNCENVKCLLDEFDRQIKQAEYNSKETQRLLTDVLSHSLHPNHYLIINMKFGLVDEVVRKINYRTGAKDFVPNDEIMEAIRYTKDILSVTRVICPGRTYCVGVVLYFLASCLFALKYRRDFPCKFTDAQIQNVANEAWLILHVEADGTTYRDMALFLEEKSLVAKLENTCLS